MLAHNPLEFNTYTKTQADLVLSGHIHGGIVVLPFLGGLLSPNIKFFPKYFAGGYKKDNTLMGQGDVSFCPKKSDLNRFVRQVQILDRSGL